MWFAHLLLGVDLILHAELSRPSSNNLLLKGPSGELSCLLGHVAVVGDVGGGLGEVVEVGA